MQTPCRLSLSHALSLFTFMTCYQSLQTVLIQKIVRRAWSGANKHTKSYNLVRLCVRWSRNVSDKYLLSNSCHVRIKRGGGRGSGPPLPLKNHKNIGFPSNIDPSPLKSQSYQASIQWWAIDTPAKRHFKGVSLMGRWWSIFSGVSVLSHYPLGQNVLDPRMHAVQVNRLDWN